MLDESDKALVTQAVYSAWEKIKPEVLEANKMRVELHALQCPLHAKVETLERTLIEARAHVEGVWWTATKVYGAIGAVATVAAFLIGHFWK
jgi:chitodextrinase